MSIAIIGAGMAGLSAAHALVENGRSVQLFDKGRGPGGRMSTRRAATPIGDTRFDHGAQFFTARDEGFRQVVQTWREASIVAPWTGRFVTLAADGRERPAAEKERLVGCPGMNEVIRAMAKDLELSWQHRVTSLNKTTCGWSIAFDDDKSAGPFEAVLLAVPAEQVTDLIASIAPSVAADAQHVVSAPCWTVMASFGAPFSPGWQGAEIEDNPLAWAADNSSKPGRPKLQSWVLQASGAWSAENLERPAEAVCKDLVAAFCALTGAPEPVYQTAHRWRYAKTLRPASVPELWDEQLQIGTCGDWRRGARIEEAWLSGRNLAKNVLSNRNRNNTTCG